MKTIGGFFLLLLGAILGILATMVLFQVSFDTALGAFVLAVLAHFAGGVGAALLKD